MQLAIFPLRLNLLPDGVLPLRIFEPRYMRMIAESSRRGMGLCLLGKSLDGGYSPLLTVGTRVEIIDFDLLADNTLSVTLKGVERFKIHAMEVEPDGLLSAEVQLLPGWHHERWAGVGKLAGGNGRTHRFAPTGWCNEHAPCTLQKWFTPCRFAQILFPPPHARPAWWARVGPGG